MNDRLILIIGFLLGLFLTLSYFSINNNFYNIKSNIKKDKEEKKNTLERFDVSTTNTSNLTTSNVVLTPELSTNVLPKITSKYMFLNTYNNNLSNSEQKWYDNDINYNTLSAIDFNTGMYFIYNNPIELTKPLIEGGTSGANINKVQLNGPNALYFANNNKINNFELSSFSLIFMLKINKFINNVMLFEMLANTSVIDIGNEEPKYLANSVSIYIIIRDDANYDIEITIGNTKYPITNIDKKILLSVDINLIALIFDGLNITFVINNSTYKFKYQKTDLITLGSSPVIINKDGDLNAIVYSVVFYKTPLTLDDIVAYKKYNYNFIYGVNYADELRKKSELLLNDAISKTVDKDQQIKDLLEQLNKCSGTNLDTISNNLNNLNDINTIKPPLPTLL